MSRAATAAAVILAALIPLAPALLRGDVPSFRDHEDYFGPLRAFTAEALRAGELPLWNPYNASGEPWLANPQTGVFYPPAWLVAVLPFETGYVAFLVVHLAVLGLGLRRLFMVWTSDVAATIVSVAFIVSGPALSLLDVSNNLATFAWTPWLLARALSRGSTPRVLDSILLALSFLGGEPLLAVVTWAAWAGIHLARLGRGALAQVAWRLFTAAMLCAAQLFPFVSLLAGSDRAGGLAPEVAFRHSMALGDWLAVIVSPAGVQPGIGASQMFLPSLYLSPIVVFLGLAAIPGRDDRRARIGWLVVLVLAMIFASGNQLPLVGRLFEWLQLTVSRYPVKLALFGFVAIGVLSAIGFDRLESMSTRARLSLGLGAAALFAIAHFLHRSPHAVVAATGLAVGLFWVAGFWALLRYGKGRTAAARAVLVVALLPVVVAESVAASRFLLGSAPWPPRNPYASHLDPDSRVLRLELLDAMHTGSGHVRDRAAWMGGYLNLLARQHDASTAAPVLDRRYQHVHDLALTGPRRDLLDLLSVRYVLTERSLVSHGYRMIASYEGVAVFERPDVPPILAAEFAPRSVSDSDEAWVELTSTPASRGHQALARGLLREYPAEVPEGAAMRILAMDFSASSARAEVILSHAALLVLSQKRVEGWSVTVDGEPRNLVSVNALFRGVEVDAGRREVIWRYRPRSLRAGIFASIAAILSLALEWRRVRAIQKRKSRSFHFERA